MDYYYTISEYIGLINQLMICYFFTKRKLNLDKIECLIGSMIFIIIEFVCIRVFNEPIKYLASIVLGLVIYTFFNSKKNQILLNMSTYILAIFIEGLLTVISEYICWICSIPTVHDIYTKLLVLIILLVIVIIKFRFKDNYKRFNYVHLNLFLSTGFYSAIIIFLVVSNYREDLTSNVSILLISTAIITLLFDILIYYFYIQSEKRNVETREKLILKDKLIDLQHQRYVDMVESYSQIKKFKHDTKGYLATIQQFILNEDYTCLNVLVDDIDNRLKNSDVISCNNPCIGAIVNHFNNVYKEETILFEFDYRIIAFIDVPLDHLCSLFYNLLENAREAVIDLKTKVIKLTIKSKDKALIISLDNSIEEKNFSLNVLKNKTTTKSNKLNHGIGLINIEEVVKFYNGAIEYKQEDDMLHTTIVLLNVITK